MEDLHELFRKKNDAHEKLLNETIQLNTEIHRRKQTKIDTLKKKQREKFKKKLDILLNRKKNGREKPKLYSKKRDKSKNKKPKKNLSFFEKIKKSLMFESSDEENKKDLEKEYKMVVKKNTQELRNPKSDEKQSQNEIATTKPKKIPKGKEPYEPDSPNSEDELYMNYYSESMNEVSSNFSFTDGADGVEVKLQRLQNIDKRKKEIYEEADFEKITLQSLSKKNSLDPGNSFQNRKMISHGEPITSIDPGLLASNIGNEFAFESEVISRVRNKPNRSNFGKQKDPDIDIGDAKINKDMLFTQISQFDHSKNP